MHKSTSKTEDLKKFSTELSPELSTEIGSPKCAHSAIICGQTGFGKTDSLESEYVGVFENIVIFCPTIEWNKAYKNRRWIGDVRRPKDKKYNNSQSNNTRRKTDASRTVTFIL